MGKIYLLYGEEKYDLEQKVEKIKKEFPNLEIGINLFFITEDNILELDKVSQGVSFFGEQKLIIIKNTKLKFNVENIIDYANNGNTYIIIEDSVDKRLVSYKMLAKTAEIIEFKNMDQAQMTSYIMQILKKYNINITKDVASYMVEVCLLDKTNIINELNKIVSYLDDDNKVVTKEVIDIVCSKTLNAKIFDMLDMIMLRKKVDGIKLLEELLLQKESIVKIYILLYKQIKQIYLIKLMKQMKKQNIAQELSIHPYVFQKLSKVSEMYSSAKLEKIIKEFDKYDEKTKNGEMDFENGLKKIICMI